VRMPLFRGMKRWGLLLSAMLLSSLLLAACGGNSPTILNPSGPVALKESNLFWFILVVASIVFVAVEGLLIYSIVRFRERPNTPNPVQTHGNNTVEIIWTVVPSFFLFVVLIGTIYTMFGLTTFSSTNSRPLQVKVVGHQWWWEFDYSNENIVTADELVIPVGTRVEALLHSDNVIHSFWVPELFGKTDVIPGHNNMSIFQADRVGEYRGQCTEFCGLEHAHMNFYVIVKSQDDYNAWVTAQQQASAATPTDPNALAGQKLFVGSGGCQGCHGIVGVNLTNNNRLKSGGDASLLVGPNLTHFGSRRDIAGAILQWDPATCVVVTGSDKQPKIQNPEACGLYQWLKDPQAVKPGNDMVIRSLSDTEIAQLIAYLETLT
jgi:cytochrome c oxidase subunit II